LPENINRLAREQRIAELKIALLLGRTINILAPLQLRDEHGSSPAEEKLETYCREVLTSVERLHFDNKTKRDSRTPQLEDYDKKNLAKALSGFANSSGGVLLWGVKGNTVPTLTPIAQIQTFMGKLLELGGLATEPSVLGIDGTWIPSKHDSTAGFGAIFVPESSLLPHRVALKLKRRGQPIVRNWATSPRRALKSRSSVSQTNTLPIPRVSSLCPPDTQSKRYLAAYFS
jgi:hypothetical protein